MKLDRRSLVLLAVQLALVSSIAAKYFYERMTCPRVWVETRAYDPELVLRGRYLSMQLLVDACGVQLPNTFGKPGYPGGPILYLSNGDMLSALPAKLGAKGGKLAVLELADPEKSETNQYVELMSVDGCKRAVLQESVDFYLPEHADSQFTAGPGKYLWAEVTVPPNGPPRPIQLAVNDHGVWKPIKY